MKTPDTHASSDGNGDAQSVAFSYWPSISASSLIGYAGICFTLLMMVVSIPWLFPPNPNAFGTQVANAAFQILFGLFGFLVSIKIRLKEKKRLFYLKTLMKDPDKEEYRGVITLIQNAFPWLKKIKRPEEAFNCYERSQAGSVDTITTITFIWGAWVLFYIVYLIKNWLFFKSQQPVDGGTILFYEAAEILANNIVGGAAFILYLKFTLLGQYRRVSVYAVVVSILLVSIAHVLLLQAPGINPHQINWFFKLGGSLLNGIALSLLFMQLCSKLIGAGSWYAFIFFSYAVSQPLILLQASETVILRIPPKYKDEQAAIMVRQLTGGIDKMNKDLALEKDTIYKQVQQIVPMTGTLAYPEKLDSAKAYLAGLAGKIQDAGPLTNGPETKFVDRIIAAISPGQAVPPVFIRDSVVQRIFKMYGTLTERPIQLTVDSMAMIHQLSWFDLDTAYLNTVILSSGIPRIKKDALLKSVRPFKYDLFLMDEVATVSLVRRWFLAFGKCFFLIYVIWLFEKRRTIWYFMPGIHEQIKKENNDFDHGSGYLPDNL